MAYALQEGLEFDADATAWTQGVFQPTHSTLEDLLHRTQLADFAAMVLTPDDLVVIRERASPAPRDNVIFELGLFIGAIGPSRCFIVAPRTADLHLPTDLLGITPLGYMSDRQDGNLVAALGPVCNQIRRSLKQGFKKTLVAAEQTQAESAIVTKKQKLEDFIATWEGADLSALRANLKAIPLDPYDDDFPHSELRRVFAFLESLSDAVLSGDIDEEGAKSKFGTVVTKSWPQLATLLAPPNHVDEWWDPPPQLAKLFERWRS